jgi:hypothetical protein
MSGIETGAQWRTKGDLARWIAQRAGVDPAEVEAAHRARTEARGEVWRSDDELTRVRKKAFARLRQGQSSTTTTTTSASRATPTTGTAATSASERAARFTGRIGR